MSNLNNRVAVIAGGASGIGNAVARDLARHGVRVALLDIEQAKPAEAASEIDGAAGFVVDVRDSASLDRAADEIRSLWGRVDILFTSAGIGSASTVLASDMEALARIVDINLIGSMRSAKAFLPDVIDSKGYILFMGSASALKNMPKASAYAAAKNGLEGFAGALRMEVAHKGVSVGVAYSTWVATAMIQASNARSGDAQALPWPLSVVNTVEEASAAIVDGIEKRSRAIYIPRALVLADRLRAVFKSRWWDRRMSAFSRRVSDEADTKAAEAVTS